MNLPERDLGDLSTAVAEGIGILRDAGLSMYGKSPDIGTVKVWIAVMQARRIPAGVLRQAVIQWVCQQKEFPAPCQVADLACSIMAEAERLRREASLIPEPPTAVPERSPEEREAAIARLREMIDEDRGGRI